MAKKIPAPKVDKTYGAMLIEIARERLKLSDVELGRLAGIAVAKQGDQNIQRLRTGNGSVLLAYRVRVALTKAGVKLPPLVVGADDEQRRWIEAGERLREHAPAEFATELELHESRVEALKKRATERAAQVKDLDSSSDGGVFPVWKEAEPQPIRRDRAADGRGPGYVPKSDGSKDEGKVGRARKPPRSDGR